MNMVAIALSCTFFVYALAVKMHQDIPMENSRVNLLLKLFNLVSSQQPLGFCPRALSFDERD